MTLFTPCLASSLLLSLGGVAAASTIDTPMEEGAIDLSPPGATARKHPSARNAIYLELGGNSALFTLNYERYLRTDLALRVGGMYMSVSASDGSGSANVSMLSAPVMINYLGLSAGSHALELGAGVNLMYLSAAASTFEESVSASGMALVPTATLGYRYSASDGGFLFRAGYTPLFFVTSEEKAVFHWGGMSAGYRF